MSKQEHVPPAEVRLRDAQLARIVEIRAAAGERGETRGATIREIRPELPLMSGLIVFDFTVELPGGAGSATEVWIIDGDGEVVGHRSFGYRGD